MHWVAGFEMRISGGPWIQRNLQEFQRNIADRGFIHATPDGTAFAYTYMRRGNL